MPVSSLFFTMSFMLDTVTGVVITRPEESTVGMTPFGSLRFSRFLLLLGDFELIFERLLDRRFSSVLGI